MKKWAKSEEIHLFLRLVCYQSQKTSSTFYFWFRLVFRWWISRLNMLCWGVVVGGCGNLWGVIPIVTLESRFSRVYFGLRCDSTPPQYPPMYRDGHPPMHPPYPTSITTPPLTHPSVSLKNWLFRQNQSNLSTSGISRMAPPPSYAQLECSWSGQHFHTLSLSLKMRSKLFLLYRPIP